MLRRVFSLFPISLYDNKDDNCYAIEITFGSQIMHFVWYKVMKAKMTLTILRDIYVYISNVNEIW